MFRSKESQQKIIEQSIERTTTTKVFEFKFRQAWKLQYSQRLDENMFS